MSLAVADRATALRTRLADALATPQALVLRRVAGIWLASRVMLAVGTVLAVVLGEAQTTSQTTAGHTVFSLHDLLWRWHFWDGAFYTDIAQYGYYRPAYAPWFPLFPLLQHLAALGTPHVFYAGLIVANLATLGSCSAVALLARAEHQSALPPVLVLLASPFAFFLAAPYSETLVIGLAALALLAMRRGAFGWAAAAIALATLAHPVGLVLVPPLVYEIARQRSHLRWPQLVLPIGGSFASIGLWMLYCWHQWGDPLAFAHAVRLDHGRTFLWPWQTVGLVWQQLSHAPLGSYATVRQLLDVLPVVAVLAVMFAARRHIPVAFTLYSLGVVLLLSVSPLVDPTIPAALAPGGRLMLDAVPVWLVLGQWTERSRTTEWMLTTGAMALQAILIVFELNHGWLI